MSLPEFDVRSEYVGNGSTADYTFDFKIRNLQQLIVGVVTNAFVTTFRVRGDDVTYLTSVDFDPINGGGEIHLTSNLPTNHKLYILLADDEPVQESEFRNKSSFTLRDFENALDDLGGQIQRLKYQTNRCLKLNDNLVDSEMDQFDTLIPVNSIDDGVEDNAGKVLIIGSDNKSFDLGPVLSDLTQQAGDAQDSADDAAASAAAAAAYAVSAAAQVTLATTQAGNAATSASNASTSASNASTSASNASASAAAAAQSAIDAASYASGALAVSQKTANHTLLDTDEIIEATGANSWTLTLAAASTAKKKRYTIANSGTGVITIVPNGADTVAGETSQMIMSGIAIEIIPNGVSNWIVV